LQRDIVKGIGEPLGGALPGGPDGLG